TRHGGFCAVVIGTVLEKGVHTPLPFHLVGRMERLGWEFHQDVVWSKLTGGVKRARRGEARRRQRSLMQFIPTQKNEVARFNRGVLCVFPTSSDPTSSLLLLHTHSRHPPH